METADVAGERPGSAPDDGVTGEEDRPEITEEERFEVLRLAVEGTTTDEVRQGLGVISGPVAPLPAAIINGLNALRKQKDPQQALGRPQYRPVLPFVALGIADGCLARTIETLGDHADDPTREQLVEALDVVREEFSDRVIAVMLAHVASEDMEASDLCFDLVTTDERYGLVGLERDGGQGRRSGGSDQPIIAESGAADEVRTARKARRQREAAERKRQQEVARKAAEQLRASRKKERLEHGQAVVEAPDTDRELVHVSRKVSPDARRPQLSPVELDGFDPDDPWMSAIVLCFIPFDADDPEAPTGGGKVRPCVVVAGSPTHLLVRAGYSAGGVKSRDWRAVPLTHWRRAGLTQPTWIDIEKVVVERSGDFAPVGWLSAPDWNALW